jgi:hypothetical protein
MKQYRDLAVKDLRMGVSNLNGLRMDCKMNYRALGRFRFEHSGRRGGAVGTVCVG